MILVGTLGSDGLGLGKDTGLELKEGLVRAGREEYLGGCLSFGLELSGQLNVAVDLGLERGVDEDVNLDMEVGHSLKGEVELSGELTSGGGDDSENSVKRSVDVGDEGTGRGDESFQGLGNSSDGAAKKAGGRAESSLDSSNGLKTSGEDSGQVDIESYTESGGNVG